MGYRAHVNRKRIIEYGEGIFNHCQQDLAVFLYELKDKMNPEYCPFNIDDDWDGVLKDEWEIEREWLENAVKYIKENMDLKDIAFHDYTFGDVVTNFEYWLDQSENKDNFTYPEFVYLTWF